MAAADVMMGFSVGLIVELVGNGDPRQILKACPCTTRWLAGLRAREAWKRV